MYEKDYEVRICSSSSIQRNICIGMNCQSISCKVEKVVHLRNINYEELLGKTYEQQIAYILEL